jgi:hypothetical protein
MILIHYLIYTDGSLNYMQFDETIQVFSTSTDSYKIQNWKDHYLHSKQYLFTLSNLYSKNFKHNFVNNLK